MRSVEEQTPRNPWAPPIQLGLDVIFGEGQPWWDAINDNPNGLAMGFPECGNTVAPAKRAHVSSDVENHKKRKTKKNQIDPNHLQNHNKRNAYQLQWQKFEELKNHNSIFHAFFTCCCRIYAHCCLKVQEQVLESTKRVQYQK